MNPREVVDFWRDAGPGRWFTQDEDFDEQCEMAFGDAHEQAAAGAFGDWMANPEGALALVILLDQIPRNIHRGSARAYATDPLAREVARHAVAMGYDAHADEALRMFFYLPFMHSEDPDDQQRSLELSRALSGPDADRWALHHHAIIETFGRFPHRNAGAGTAEHAAGAGLARPGRFQGLIDTNTGVAVKQIRDSAGQYVATCGSASALQASMPPSTLYSARKPRPRKCSAVRALRRP